MYDYIPRKEAELLSWSKNFLKTLRLIAATWGIPQSKIDELSASIADFGDCLKKTQGPDRTSVLVEMKHLAAQRLTHCIRTLVNTYLRNPEMLNDTRLRLGLPIRDTTLTRLHPPSDPPLFEVRIKDARLLRIHFYEKHPSVIARPYGLVGAVIRWKIGGPPPLREEELNNTCLATRTPHTLTFRLEDRGQPVYIALCWETRRGERSPWSLIVQSFIP
ncbi:MAG: hypothetical protein LBS05_10320 [Tannerellaceae bacterium]|jgi:hypothetical protein|nr:hypothetical protein [Tannerellaceae bacterium]